MTKHSRELTWAMAMAVASGFAQWRGDHIWALLLAFGAGFTLHSAAMYYRDHLTEIER